MGFRSSGTAENVWTMGYYRVMGYHLQTKLVPAKSYGFKQIMGFLRYGLGQV